MNHNFRINGEVKQIVCELGSGIFDKNGKEIFEGDRVVYKGNSGIAFFSKGDFILDGHDLYCFLSGVDLDGQLEIVGHVSD